MNAFHDTFYIMAELKVISMLMTCLYLTYILIDFALPMLFEFDAYDAALFSSWLKPPSYILLMHASTMYVLKITELKRSATKVELFETEQLKQRFKSDDNIARHSDLEALFQDKILFEAFVRHLSGEWSLEVLLGFIEMTQLQETIRNYHEKQLMNDFKLSIHSESEAMLLSSKQTALLKNDFIVDSFIAHSPDLSQIMERENISLHTPNYTRVLSGARHLVVEIVDNSSNNKVDEIDQFKIRSFALYRKYICDGSDLQLNISHGQRKTLDDLLRDFDELMANDTMMEVELFQLYAGVIDETSNLLFNAFRRWKHKG